MLKNILHKSLCNSNSKLADWYCEKLKHLQYPVYSSYDIRDAGFKIANVDANIYPAGFNNICMTDQDHAGDIFAKYLESHYGKDKRKILLLTEEHRQNPFYWDNVFTIKKLLENAGKTVMLAVPRNLPEPWLVQSAQGHELTVYSGWANDPEVQKFNPDIVVSNNDFSDAQTEWWDSWADKSIPLNPPRDLGWYQRKKSRYFHFYNQLVTEFSQQIGQDPFLMNVQTELFPEFHPGDEDSLKAIADRIDHMLENLRQEYEKRKINSQPFVFVKNNAGTYGLAVMRVGSGKEIMEWNSKSKKKMKAAKGGRDVSEVIIQEGIPSRVQHEGITSEPVVYMIGRELGGGFLRSHAEKNATESLNSPGAVYKRLCVSDLNISLEGHPLENVYGWSARLGLMAIAMEANDMKVKFQGWKP